MDEIRISILWGSCGGGEVGGVGGGGGGGSRGDGKVRTSVAEFVFLKVGEMEEKEVGRRWESEKVRNSAAVLVFLDEDKDKEIVEK